MPDELNELKQRIRNGQSFIMGKEDELADLAKLLEAATDMPAKEKLASEYLARYLKIQKWRKALKVLQDDLREAAMQSKHDRLSTKEDDRLVSLYVQRVMDDI